uniref:Uncharacterized protein n=1 Tax=Arundo donax TaxID=35708 RepID=A0A0A9C606_ARUDO
MILVIPSIMIHTNPLFIPTSFALVKNLEAKADDICTRKTLVCIVINLYSSWVICSLAAD